MIRSRDARAGFPIIELVLAVGVLALVVVVVLPKLSNAGERNKEAALETDLSTLRQAVSRFHDHTSLYPASLADLAATIAPPQGVNEDGAPRAITSVAWHGPYLKSVPTDPISGMEFRYYTTPIGGHQVGEVRSSAAGPGSGHTLYSEW